MTQSAVGNETGKLIQDSQSNARSHLPKQTLIDSTPAVNATWREFCTKYGLDYDTVVSFSFFQMPRFASSRFSDLPQTLFFSISTFSFPDFESWNHATDIELWRTFVDSFQVLQMKNFQGK